MRPPIKNRFTSGSLIQIGHQPKPHTVPFAEPPAGCVAVPRPWAYLDWHPGDGLLVTQEEWVKGLCPGDHNPAFQRREYKVGGELDHYKCPDCGQGETRWRPED